MFLRCPRQYEFRYIEGLKIPPSGAMVQSRVWHETLENNYKQKITSDTDLPLPDMQEYFAARYDEVLGNEEVTFEEDENPARLKDQGVSIVSAHHKIIAPRVRPAIVEEKFLISLGDDFPYELMGIWDLIEADGTIVDNKAYKRTPSQEDIDRDLQFTLYSLGYRASKKQIEKGIRMDAVIKNKQPRAVQLRTSRTNEDCRWLLSLIEKVVQAIQSGTFYPNPSGWHCSPKFCGYWEKCKR
jgi:hypothetical protein